MDITDLQYEAKGPVAWIRFNRPARRNALCNMSTRHLVQLCRQADQDAAVKAVVITGQGEAFCAGGDIQDTFQRGATMSEQQWSDRIREGPNVLAQLIQTHCRFDRSLHSVRKFDGNPFRPAEIVAGCKEVLK